MEIERHWGREPGWFHALEDDAKVQLMAWWQVYCDPKGEGPTKKKPRGRG